MLLVFEATVEYLLGCVGVASLFPINFLHFTTNVLGNMLTLSPAAGGPIGHTLI
jgi:hypothetical protein